MGSLLRIYEQTDYKPIAQALVASQWKGPVMGRTDEFWTSPFFKTYRWNFEKGTEAGPEAVAALSGNPYVRSLLDRNIRPDRNQVAWYRGDIKPRRLPDRYTIPDRNVMGPRAWYGDFTYAGTFRRTSPQDVAGYKTRMRMNVETAGHETLMGAMTVDTRDGRLNSILTGITPRIWMLPEDSKANSAWAMLTTDLVGATTITRNFSVATELTFSNREKEPGPPGEQTHFPADTDFRFVVEIRPAWITAPVEVKTLGDHQLPGLQVIHENRGFQVWLNASGEARKCTLQRGKLPHGQTSISQSDGVLGRAAFKFDFEEQPTLLPGQHAVLVVSPNALDHEAGWRSFADMTQNNPR